MMRLERENGGGKKYCDLYIVLTISEVPESFCLLFVELEKCSLSISESDQKLSGLLHVVKLLILAKQRDP